MYDLDYDEQDEVIAGLRRITEQQDRTIDGLRQQLRQWVPHPSEMRGWDDQECLNDVAALIREACEIHGVEVPEHLKETR